MRELEAAEAGVVAGETGVVVGEALKVGEDHAGALGRGRDATKISAFQRGEEFKKK